ncbi:coiled-coil domain-containing protein 24 isoform X2 [Betta splendens]|uniref:Coiled-coil domain-containing protein 24 isoform X2 n=1 Tax=Betta splendens TaxID=158456 RepID=A0A6P7KY47_BETSP|nr:coiled-coil domain-containing protein 24 isoform X2 [Betta splendens]
MQSLDEKQLSPGPSLWNLITEHVHCSEVPKICAALGHSLVDMYIELHSEAEMCYKMWQQTQQGGSRGSRAGTSTPCGQGTSLSEPPAVKELLRAEVKMLLQTLRERASGGGGRDGEELLLRYNPDTVNYALGHRDTWFPGSSSGETDNGSEAGNTISIEDEMKAVSDKLNATDIDQVVDRLKSVMLEECDVLKRRVQGLKANINQKYRRKSEFPKPEPSLVDLRELRAAVQMDLDLYPSSLAAPSTDSFHLPVKGLENKWRASAGHVASDETLQVVNATSVLRPHPPRPLCCADPRPPAGPPHTHTSRSLRPVRISTPPVTHGQHRRISSAGESNGTRACMEITTSEEANGQFTTDQMNKCEHSRLSPEPGGAGLHRRDSTSSLRLQIKTQPMLPAQEAHLSSHCSRQGLNEELDLLPFTERTGSVWRSGNTSSAPSLVPVLSSLCGAGSHRSSSSTGDFKSTTQKRQHKGSCGGSFVSTVEQTDDRVKTTGQSLCSQNDMMSNSGIESGDVRKDRDPQQCPTDHLRHLESSSSSSSSDQQRRSRCRRLVAVQTKTPFFSSPIRPHGGIAAQTKRLQETQTQMEMINTFHQPVPPARVPT